MSKKKDKSKKSPAEESEQPVAEQAAVSPVEPAATAKPDGSQSKKEAPLAEAPPKKPHYSTKEYEAELRKLQIELVKLQEWVKAKELKLVVIFEGRDAAGKGGDDQADHRNA